MFHRLCLSTARLALSFILLSGLLSFPSPSVQAKPPQPLPPILPLPSKSAATDHILVKLRSSPLVSSQSLERAATGNSSLDHTLLQAGGRRLKPAFAHPLPNVKDPSGLERIFRVDLRAGQSVEDTIALLSADPSVEYAEPDYLAQKIAAPNDPQYAQQWGLAKIQTEGAWDLSFGSPNVIIAVVDSGIDLSHEDLVDNLWINPGEIPANDIDDDNNGFIDDLGGWNFIASSNDLWDDNGHGTLVAGIAAATSNNAKGIAGVCGLCRIMPVKVMQPSGSANYSDIAAGINYAVVKGARVINLSLGGYANSKALQDAVNNALAQNIVVVAGSGNDNTSNPFYPAAYPGVISVAATDSSDHKANFSNYGSWVKVSAPGVDVLTTALGGDYLLSSGTSQSSPFVSGLAGLLVTLHPDWTPAMVLGQITHTVDAIDALNPGLEGKLGVGRINATKALQPAYPILTFSGFSANGTANGRPDFNADASLSVSLANDWADALGVSATLSTTDPTVTVTTPTADLGDILSGQMKSNPIPFAIHIAPAAGYNHAISFKLDVTANGGAYTKSFSFTVSTRSSVEDTFGTIADDTLWTNDKTYKITGNVGVAPGVTLTIQPGTVVQFAGNFAFNVAGTLIANGTASQPILFEPFTTGQTWSRISIDDLAQDGVSDVDGNYVSGTSLSHVTIRGAASGLQCTNATPLLSSITITSGGISCTMGDSPFSLPNSSITGNVSASGYVYWPSKASMAAARYGLAAVSSGQKIFAFGGTSNGIVFARTEIYDSASNIWSTGMDMPTPRMAVGAAEVNGKIYVVGGYGSSYVPTMEAYDIALGTWQTLASMPTTRGGMGVATLDGKIYAAGGNDGSPISTVEMYDPATNLWSARASLPFARDGLALVSANGKLYAIGGRRIVGGISSPITDLDEYDPLTDTWTSRVGLSLARDGISATVLGGKIYVIGGNNTACRTNVDVYDLLTNAWTSGHAIPTVRCSPAAVSLNGTVYVLGGYASQLGYDVYASMISLAKTSTYNYQVLNSIIKGSLALADRSLVMNSQVNGGTSIGELSLVTNSSTGPITLGAQSQVTFSTTGAISTGTSSTIEDNLVSGSLTLSGGTAQRNQVSGGNLSGGTSCVINQNVVTVGGISAGNSSTLTGNSVENSPTVGLQAGSGSTVTGNRIIGAVSHGITASTGTIEGNLVANITGDGLRAGAADIENNTFTGIKGNGVYLNGIPTKMEGNNFEFNTGTYDLYNDNPAGQYTLAPRNWWGTTITTTIRSRVYDFNVDMYKGRVTFTPILTGSSQTAPAYVRSLTLDPPSPIGIQTVNFSVEYSRPMDVSSNPKINFRSSSWDEMASMPTARYGVGAIADSNGKIYAIGGYGPLATVEEYNPSTNTWIKKIDMPTARGGFGIAAAANGKIYVIGGYTTSGPVATVEEYDPSTDTWMTKTSMPTARYELGAAYADNGKIYAIGGYNSGAPTNNNGALSTVEEYDPSTDIWTTKASMSTTRHGLGVVAANNGKIYAIGGYSFVERWRNTVEEYDPTTNTWRNKAGMPTPRHGVGVTVISNGDIYAIGGDFYDVALPFVEVYNPSTNIWTIKTSMSNARYSLGVVATSNGKVYAIGGRNYIPNTLFTVEAYTPDYAVTSNSQWSDTTHYHASFDFTSLISRGIYLESTQDAWGLDGLAVAPYQGTDFVVDYAGYISVTTPPNIPVVSAWGNGSLTTLSAQWSATDPQGAAITGYRYAIGTTLGGVDVVNWTNVSGTSLNRTGLNLTLGRNYYVLIKARNEGGLWSQASSSNPVEAGVVTPPTLSSIAPSSTLAGSGAFTLTVSGSSFTPASVIRWNGTDLPTTFMNSTQLNTTVGIDRLGTGGFVNVTVFTSGATETNAQVFTIQNPAPSLTNLSPASAVMGESGFTLTIAGTNFVSGSIIRWNSTDLTTNYVSSTQLNASIDASMVSTAGTASVTVFSPSPGGGITSALTFTINNPSPTASNLSPDQITAGSAGFTLNLTGTSFVTGSIIRWNDTNLTTNFVSSTQLTANIDAGFVVAAGTVNVTVFNPNPGGGITSPLTFKINNPAPNVSSLLPDQITAGNAGFTLTLNGDNFVSGSVIRWNGVDLTTSFVSSAQLTASIDAVKVAAAGTVNVTVFNPTPGGGITSPLTFTINNPVPNVSGLSPDQIIAGSAGFTLTVNGTNFVSGSVIRWNGTDLTTAYINNARLTATISASKVASVGTVDIAVYNPAPGGGMSGELVFAISLTNPQPQLTQLSLTTVLAGSNTTPLTITGSNFIPSSIVRWNGADLSTTFVDSTHLIVTLAANLLTTPGSATITVFNPAPGGGASGELTITITSPNPLPQLTQLSLTSVTAGSSSTPLTIIGSNFILSSIVRWSGEDLPTTYIDSTHLSVTLAAGLLTTPGSVTITVFNPAPGGGSSNGLLFTVLSRGNNSYQLYLPVTIR